MFVKMDETVHLRPMHFTVCKFRLNFKKKCFKRQREVFTMQ